MKRTHTVAFLLIILLIIASCAGDNETTYYRIAYDGNGNTGGSVPVDDTAYPKGDSLSFMDNTGKLVKTGLCFNGWNTAADGRGTHWAPDDSVAPLESDMLLYAEWVEYGTVVTFDEADNKITDYRGESGFFDMPSAINGVPVLLVGPDAFNGAGLFAVNLPESLQGIETRAFTYNRLKSLELPENLTYLESLTFDNNGLTSVTLPANLAVIRENAFYYNDLDSIDLRAATTIESSAFHGNPLTRITIGASVDIAPSYSDSGRDYHTLGKYGDSFRTLYYGNGRQAGTYTYAAGSWTKIL